MKKYLAITAALALTLTACGQAAADSTPTPTAATEAAAAPAEQPQSICSGVLRLLTAAADGVYYQAFNDWEINYTDTMGRALIYAIDEQTGDARPVCSLPGCAHNSDTCPAWSDGNTTLCYGDGDEVYLLNSITTMKPAITAGNKSIPTTPGAPCWQGLSRVCPSWAAVWPWTIKTCITACWTMTAIRRCGPWTKRAGNRRRYADGMIWPMGLGSTAPKCIRFWRSAVGK